MRCAHHEAGCLEEMTYKEYLGAHEERCPYNKMQCPVTGCSVRIRCKAWFEHLQAMHQPEQVLYQFLQLQEVQEVKIISEGTDGGRKRRRQESPGDLSSMTTDRAMQTDARAKESSLQIVGIAEEAAEAAAEENYFIEQQVTPSLPEGVKYSPAMGAEKYSRHLAGKEKEKSPLVAEIGGFTPLERKIWAKEHGRRFPLTRHQFESGYCSYVNFDPVFSRANGGRGGRGFCCEVQSKDVRRKTPKEPALLFCAGDLALQADVRKLIAQCK
ncbi:hypothetical protein CYMTET_16970 [Cymbomonas tetramitiformis]|uniref:SIAH-type domain-containing protein n=1 Tax=Cymbomonas tetramitiformis TaxID=36881 RepID=A0AAE0GAV3_9CHLO|nr:hypothetical protein CYMTET_16970 [Cymbomonas tetramitiformis]